MRLKGHARKGEKSQIALEFIIVYSFVLVIFLVIFALIAAQRASTLSAQQFSSLELITQNIATNIDHALAAGSGYTATIPIVGSISALPYNLYLSSTGVVLANMTIGKQVISAEAYSSARSISVNATFQGQTANDISVYNIPVYTGTMRISNSRGTIYIDQAPVSLADLPGSMNVGTIHNTNHSSLPATSLKAASFNGASSYVDIGNPASLQFSSGTMMVLSAWVKITNCNHGGAIIGHGTSSYTLYYYTPSAGACSISFASSTIANIGAGVPISTGTWHNVVIVNNIGTNVYIYIDGTQYGPYTFTNTYSYTEDLRIGDSQSDSGFFFNGSIANVQIYNKSLSANNIQALYQEGVNSPPISDAGLRAWYPLDGNAQDYGPNNYDGAANNVTFTNNSMIQSGALDAFNISKAVLPRHAVFNWKNGYIVTALPTNAVVNVTINAWIKTTANPGYTNVFLLGDNGGSNGYGIFINHPGCGTDNISILESSVRWICTGVVISPSTWDDLLLSASSSSGDVVYSIYIDGKDVYTSSPQSLPPAPQAQMRLGNDPANGGYFNGSIADVQVYNTALTSAQARQLYLNNSVEGISPIAYWPLSGGLNGTYNVTPDITGNGFNGQLYSNATSQACRSKDVVNGVCGVEYT